MRSLTHCCLCLAILLGLMASTSSSSAASEDTPHALTSAEVTAAKDAGLIGDVPTQTKQEFLEGSPAKAPDPADVWCFVYSTAAGWRFPLAGAAIGAACLFTPKSTGQSLYSCYKTAPVNLGYGLVAKYGAKGVYRSGRCLKGEWGYLHGKGKWSQQKA
ncbi:hypothetical protein [Aeromicrobium sp. Leaf350]|uniref:hypothetical protein n=1 Tax=Aeromicrobium sp. Leaf350 TaxID=2876565 RepID=UPI001E5C8533|nr:hypothetical protein [Aeromicrobium sp. Leaf350]